MCQWINNWCLHVSKSCMRVSIYLPNYLCACHFLTCPSIHPSLHPIILLPPTRNIRIQEIKEYSLLLSSLRRTWRWQPTPWSTERGPVSTTPLTSRTAQSNASSKNSATLRGPHCPLHNWKRCGGNSFTNIYSNKAAPDAEIVLLLELNHSGTVSVVLSRQN